MKNSKLCKKCNSIKSLLNFSKSKSYNNGYKCYCKSCDNIYYLERKRRKNNNLPSLKESRIILHPYKRNSYEWNKSTNLKREFGIDLKSYNIMFESQKGKCLICKKHQSGLKSTLVVDHNHKTNKIRALLCSHCNFVLGHAFEDIIILEESIKYLMNYKYSN